MHFEFLGMDLSTFTCMLMFYSFIGWLYESTVFSLIEQGKLMNRGCFIGPYCPIYSVVAMLNLYLLNGVTSPVRIVLIASLSCCAIEYVTSYSLEKIFHARYWDYSYFPLNINGRISVISGIFFGFAILFLIKLLHPVSIIMFGKIPHRIMITMAIACWVIFWIDAVFTVIGMCNLNRKCKELYDTLDNYVEDKFDTINNKKEYLNRFVIVEKGKDMVVRLKSVNRKFVDLETRYLKVFPSFESLKYSEVIDKMKEALKRKKSDNDDIDVSDNEPDNEN